MKRGKGIWMLPLPARPLVLLTFIGYGSYLPPWERWCQSSVSRPMEAKEAKAASAVATQDFTWDSKFEQGEPSWWASSCCSGVCGLVYSETHALVAMSSGKLSVSSPVLWPWGQLAFNELHPCYWTLKNRVAAAKLTVGSCASGGSQNLGFAWWGAGLPGASLCWDLLSSVTVAAVQCQCLGIGHGTFHSTDITRACPPCLSLQQRHEAS